jgi:hypothetical protein
MDPLPRNSTLWKVLKNEKRNSAGDEGTIGRIEAEREGKD